MSTALGSVKSERELFISLSFLWRFSRRLRRKIQKSNPKGSQRNPCCPRELWGCRSTGVFPSPRQSRGGVGGRRRAALGAAPDWDPRTHSWPGWDNFGKDRAQSFSVCYFCVCFVVFSLLLLLVLMFCRWVLFRLARRRSPPCAVPPPPAPTLLFIFCPFPIIRVGNAFVEPECSSGAFPAGVRATTSLFGISLCTLCWHESSPGMQGSANPPPGSLGLNQQWFSFFLMEKG